MEGDSERPIRWISFDAKNNPGRVAVACLIESVNSQIQVLYDKYGLIPIDIRLFADMNTGVQVAVLSHRDDPVPIEWENIASSKEMVAKIFSAGKTGEKFPPNPYPGSE